MDMTVSPDVDAYICYLTVLFLGVVTASVQVSGKLKNLPGKWIMLNTWSLFAAYTAIPLALFWLLDRTSATHDTSLFAAILVGVGYQQILSTGLSSIRAPGDAAIFWKPFDAWANSIAGRIRDRVAVNSSQFDEKLLTSIIRDPAKLDCLRDIVMAHTKDADIAALDSSLTNFEKLKDILREQGVLSKKAALLYNTLRASSPQTFQFLLRKDGVISAWLYYWYAREWRSKVTASLIAMNLIAAALFSGKELLSSNQRAHYYVWRLQKVNATETDRDRARTHILHSIEDSYPHLIELLHSPSISSSTADSALSTLLDSRERLSLQRPPLPDALIDALHNPNSDVRARIQKVLLYIAKERSLTPPTDLLNWQSDPKNSSTEVDVVIKQWHSLWHHE